MHTYHTPEDFPTSDTPIVLTIGNFDGVHCGHDHILRQMRIRAGFDFQTCVVTFNNHPSQILKPTQPTPHICTLPHKIKLLKEAHVDHLLLLTFDFEFSLQTAEEFIKKIRAFIPFSHLILGHDATLGKDRQGDKSKIMQLSEQLGFEVHYEEEYCQQGQPISSTLVRKALQEGKLDQVKQLLGRPYSIYSLISRGQNQGKQIGFPTANINLLHLCLPPYGVYKVTLKHNERLIPGIANLGLAPTIKNSSTPILETHLFSFSEDLYGQEVEVIFHEFIRPEKKFANVDELKKQIQKDIEQCLCIM